MGEGEPPVGSPPDRSGPAPVGSLGSAPLGAPTFHRRDAGPPWPPSAQAPDPPPRPQPPVVPELRASRLPAVLTVAVVLVVLTVVGVATALAWYGDTHLGTPPARTGSSGPGSPPAAPAPPTPDRIEFRSSSGAGRLTLLDHRWDRAPDAHGDGDRRLRIRLEVLCTGGSVAYAPEYFSLFDADGRLVEPSPPGPGPDELPFGHLAPGERVRGWVAFDLPRGDLTLVMADDVSSVTALRLDS